MTLLKQQDHSVRLGACLAAAVLAVPLTARAAPTHYWSVQGGENRLSHWPVRVNFGGPAADGDLRLTRGAELGLAWGVQEDDARYELEYQHGRFRVTDAFIGGISNPSNANGHYDALTANALRRLALVDALSLYGGVGIGVGHIAFPHIALASGCQCLGAAAGTGFAWQARTGIEYKLSPSGAAFVQASWLNLAGASSHGAASVSYPRRGFGVFGVGYRGQY